jgi:hypothetical protein
MLIFLAKKHFSYLKFKMLVKFHFLIILLVIMTGNKVFPSISYLNIMSMILLKYHHLDEWFYVFISFVLKCKFLMKALSLPSWYLWWQIQSRHQVHNVHQGRTLYSQRFSTHIQLYRSNIHDQRLWQEGEKHFQWPAIPQCLSDHMVIWQRIWNPWVRKMSFFWGSLAPWKWPVFFLSIFYYLWGSSNDIFMLLECCLEWGIRGNCSFLPTIHHTQDNLVRLDPAIALFLTDRNCLLNHFPYLM